MLISGHRPTRPEDLAGLVVEGAEAAVVVAAEDEAAAGGHERAGGGALLVNPQQLAGLGGDGLDGADLVGAGGDLAADAEPVEGAVVGRHDARAGVAQGEVHGVGEGAVGAGLPVLAAGEGRAREDLLALAAEHDLLVLGDGAGRAVDAAHHVLGHRGPRPQELAGGAVEGVDDAGLAGDAGHDPAHLARLQAGVDPLDRLRVRGHRGVDEDALERVVEVPAVVEVLVVPDDLAGVGVEGEGRVVVEVLQVGPADEELGGRRGHRGADVDEVQLGVVAGDHPRADVLALLERHPAPRLVAGLAGGGDGAPPPQLLAGDGVVGDDDAGVRAAPRGAAAARHDLAVGDDGARALVGGVHPVVEDPGLPRQLAGGRVEGEHVVVAARVDDVGAIDGEVPVEVGEGPEHVVPEVVGQVPPVLPEEVAGGGVDGLDDVARVRHVHHAVVHEGGALLQPRPETARPHHAQVADVAAVDLVQRAVAPAVEGAPPHQPVVGRRVLQDGVGDGGDPGVLAVRKTAGRREQDRGERQDARGDSGA